MILGLVMFVGICLDFVIKIDFSNSSSDDEDDDNEKEDFRCTLLFNR